MHIPIVAVLGNHDFEAGAEHEIHQIMVDHGVCVLDGDTCEVEGIGFAGVKGFAGGFGRRALGPGASRSSSSSCTNGERNPEARIGACALRTEKKIVLLHYAPIEGTVEGEPREIYPYLGCSRLEEPLGRYGVSAVFHGHAHNGAPEGRLDEHSRLQRRVPVDEKNDAGSPVSGAGILKYDDPRRS